MRKYGLIGLPLEHSFSAGYFTEKFDREQIRDSVYELFPLESIDILPAFLQKETALCGFNVTIPYKEKIIPFLDQIEETAEKIGSVNTVKIYRQQNKIRLKGYNTDLDGIETVLKPFLKSIQNAALILGNGGASRTVQFFLKKEAIPFLVVSRNPSDNNIEYGNINATIMENCQIIINTTPLGMFPDVLSKPEIPYHLLTANHLLFDLIYNPAETLFLKEGKKQGATTINGLEMLMVQAEKAWEIWENEIFN